MKQHKQASHSAARVQPIFLTKRLAQCVKLGSSALAMGALGFAAPTWAQTDAPALEEILVSGQRSSIESAQNIKRDADQIVDSIVAEDIGKLPDRSIADTLQRVSGVTVSRFDSPGDPEHFAGEGAGVSIRGLPQVRGELNGRDIFSADGGRGLSFDDVPAELMAGVDVFKTPTADMVEGGLGGIVNLRTRMPFDADGQVISFSGQVNYGDLISESNPEFSGLYSNRWDTDAGEFGFLINLSTSEMSTRADNILTRAFFPRVPGEAGERAEIEADRTVYVTRGADWRRNDYERQRDGQYVAFQWAPNADLEFFLTGFRSKAERTWLENAFFLDAGGSFETFLPVPGADDWVYDKNNALISGTITTAQGNGIPFGTSTRLSNNTSETIDISTGFNWAASDRLTVSGDLQYVDSNSQSTDNTLGLVAFPDHIHVGNLDTTSGTPTISVAPGFLEDHNNYSYGQAMQILGDNEAEALSVRLDLEYELDHSIFRSVKVGARYTDKSADNRGGLTWSARYQPWMVGSDWQPYASTADMPKITDPRHLTQFSYGDFQRGSTHVPISGMMYRPELLNDFWGTTTEIAGITPGGNSVPDAAMVDRHNPDNINTQDETTEAFYVRTDFGFDDWAVPMYGNVGVRVVRTENVASGQLRFPTFSPFSTDDDAEDNEGLYRPFYRADQEYSGKNSYTNVLPSLNLRFEPSESVVLRFSAAQGIWRPEFWRMKALMNLSAGFNDGVAQPETIADFSEDMVNFSLDTNGTNPFLEPMEADQFDLSAEWYFDDAGGMVYAALFHKNVKDFFRESIVSLDEFEGFADVTATQTINTGTADISGFEIGATKFFTELPAPWDGLGVQANYTYVDSSTKVPMESQPIDTDGSEFGDLPLEGLAEHTYNLMLMYEKHGFHSRLAWNWRSEQLLSVGPNGWNGSNNGIDWRLPVYADDYGQLDFTMGYQINDNLTVSFEAYNISESETRGIVKQVNAGDHTAFVNSQDLRYSIGLRATF